MILVIVGHCAETPSAIKQWLYSFHMPLFFALSGYTFRVQRYANRKQLLLAKLRTLIVPYFCLSVLLWLICFVLRDRLHFTQTHMWQLAGIVLGWRMSKLYYSMWFILTLFFAEWILWELLRMARERTAVLASFAVVFFLLGVMMAHFVKGFLWSLDVVPMALAFLLIGYLLNRQNRDEKHFSAYPCLLIAWAVNILTAFLNSMPDLYMAELGNPLWFALSACSGIYGTLALCVRLKKNRCLEYIGRNTMVYYAFQAALALPAAAAFLRIASKHLGVSIPSCVSFVLQTAMACVLLALMSECIRRFCPVLLGKKREG